MPADNEPLNYANAFFADDLTGDVTIAEGILKYVLLTQVRDNSLRHLSDLNRMK